MGKISRTTFGNVDGREVELLCLTSKSGMRVELISFGAAIRSIQFPDRVGNLSDVVLGFDDLDGYLGKSGRNPYFGALVGRVANRIAGGKFELDGVGYNLAKNNGENSLHGGIKGFDKQVWNAYPSEESNSVCFTYLSKDGEEGYPGDLLVNVTYTLTDDNSLVIHMKAITSKPTPINLTNHVYFNLGGHDSGSSSLHTHVVTMNADSYTPVDNATLIPLGELRPVDDSMFDLRSPKELSEFLSENGPPAGGDKHGFDHNFCINGTGMRLVSHVEHPESGRILECHSNQPGVQFYTGNFLPCDGSLKGKGGSVYSMHGGFCLETQVYPDSINQNFPVDGVMRPGQVYDHSVSYTFGLLP